jgi:hypothetical protein
MAMITGAEAITPVQRPLSVDDRGSRTPLEFGAAVTQRVAANEKSRVEPSARGDKPRRSDPERDRRLGNHVDISV